MTTYKGINYAGKASPVNKDPKTGLRYGVINQHEVLQAWCDSSEAYYGEPHCPKCGNEVQESCGEEDFEVARGACGDYVCPDCEYMFDAEDAYGDTPISHFVDDEDLQAECGEDGDIFVTKSKYYTYAQFCSPCAPGACYLMNWLEEKDPDNRAYCLGPEWFEDGVAPYPVYLVEEL